jgi:protein-S-isoprenylcysteine O-methyltransferase Ste14
MASSKTDAYASTSAKRDNITRGRHERNYIGTACFVGSRALDPLLQYAILAKGYGSSLVERLGGDVLTQGPPLVTNTFFDVGLSPYRTILLGMSVGSMVKQNIHHLGIAQEPMSPAAGLGVGLFNAVFNSLNSIIFVCRQTSASMNGDFAQTPLIAGSILYAVGLSVELGSEAQRHYFKKDAANKGKVYTGGLFGFSRHINYFGYMLWRSGYALAAGGWTWGAVTAAMFAYDFTQRGIPVLQHYLEERVSVHQIHQAI